MTTHVERGEAPLTGGAADPALVRASGEVALRLYRRGVRLSGRETAEELVDLLDAVERFELTVERAGGDLLVDEAVRGARAPIAPDDPAFVLPVHAAREPIADFIERIAAATEQAERVHRRAGASDPQR